MADSELRRAQRYRLAATTSFWWLDPGGSTQEGRGITRDISDAGVMIMSSTCPPVGIHIEVRVFVPKRQENRFQLELHGEGKVVRVEDFPDGNEGETAKGFAASVQFYPESISDVEELDSSRS